MTAQIDSVTAESIADLGLSDRPDPVLVRQNQKRQAKEDILEGLKKMANLGAISLSRY